MSQFDDAVEMEHFAARAHPSNTLEHVLPYARQNGFNRGLALAGYALRGKGYHQAANVVEDILLHFDTLAMASMELEEARHYWEEYWA